MSLPTVSLVGNVKRPELRYNQSGKAMHKFTLECGEKNKNGEWDNLYIEVVTWEKSAEFVNQYFPEGSVAIVTGKLMTKVWEKDGKKHYDITLKFPKVEFAPKIKDGNSSAQPNSSYQAPAQQSQQGQQQYGQQQQPQYQAPQQQQRQQQMPADMPPIDETSIPF